MAEAPLTLGVFRDMTGHLPRHWQLMIRDLDCTTLTWADACVILMGVTDKETILLLSAAHDTSP